MRLSKAAQARAWAIALTVLTIVTALLVLSVNPLEVALAYLALEAVMIVAGLMTNIWGGLAASALSVFAVVLFNNYAGIYLRENRIFNIGTELGALMLLGPLAGGLSGGLNRLRQEADHWLAQSEALSVRDATFDTLQPEWAKTRLDEEALRAARFERPLSLLLLELVPGPEAPSHDRAQRVGALQAVIRVARASAPSPAIVAHAGGDQVLLILPEYTADQAQQSLADLRQRLAQEVYFPTPRAASDKSLGRPLAQWGAVRAGAVSLNGQTETGAALLARAKAALDV